MVFVQKGAERQPCISQGNAAGDNLSQRSIPMPGGVFTNRPASPDFPSSPKTLAPPALPLTTEGAIPLSSPRRTPHGARAKLRDLPNFSKSSGGA